MSKEVRSLFLVALTLTIYATSIFLKDGGFVFPYPLNSFIFFLIAVQFAYWHQKKRPLIALICATAIFGILSNPVFWEVVLSIETMGSFLNYPWIHWFNLLYILGIIAWGIMTLMKQNELLGLLLTGIGVLILGIGNFYDLRFLLPIGYAIITLSVLLKPVHQPFHLLWVLLLILEATEWITYALA
ncbi:MAG: hypothetical protein JKY09_03410 [Crocinitomicaceae bacterium]|nr:hypothetical protein [Crocinitomicaceae bacterium]